MDCEGEDDTELFNGSASGSGVLSSSCSFFGSLSSLGDVSSGVFALIHRGDLAALPLRTSVAAEVEKFRCTIRSLCHFALTQVGAAAVPLRTDTADEEEKCRCVVRGSSLASSDHK